MCGMYDMYVCVHACVCVCVCCVWHVRVCVDVMCVFLCMVLGRQ